MVNAILLSGQDLDHKTALQLVRNNVNLLGLSEEDISDSKISNAYTSNPAGIQLVYLQQTWKNLPVYNQIQVLAFKDGKLVSNAGGRIPGIETRITQSVETAIRAESAVLAALSAKNLVAMGAMNPVDIQPNKKSFGKLGVSYENITAELLWVPVNEGKQVKLGWQVYLLPVGTSDYWMIRIDASNGSLIEENNLTVYCNFDHPDKATKADHQHDISSCFKRTDFVEPVQGMEAFSPSIVNSATYRVIPFPAESPRHPGGGHVLKTDPWNAAPGNATTLKWHSNGTNDFNYTRGNNVWAQEDLNANNGTGTPATSTTGPDPLTFDFTPDYMVTPTQLSPVPNQQFNITNLFYWNNVIHDVLYQYGFDEPAGNFQANNQGRGGLGNDFVYADAQDGNYVAPNQNNANFSTPPDGGNGRMQMYLWDSIPAMRVNGPSSVAGIYTAFESTFSTANKLKDLGPRTGDVIWFNDDASGTVHEACGGSPANNISGKIALIVRGNCNFTIKVKNAQNAGAIAVIMINNVSGAPILMGGDDNTITIPAVMISDVDGALLSAQLGAGLNVTLAAPANADGAVDNGVVVHEFSHGISNRLTGGPAQAGCVSNAEHMGEGWSDYYSLMLTQDWANSTLTSGAMPRTLGTYAVGQAPSGGGIRTKPYSTDFTINNLVYTATLPGTGQQHTRGELWAATLWDMTWNIIQQVGTINPDIYNVAGGGGNIIALRLVTEAMKLQPCGPGFIDGRNAILQADQVLYGGQYSCAIREAFRRRGMGPNASQGSANSTTDQVPDFTSALQVVLHPSVTTVPEGQQITYTNTVTTCSAVTNYTIIDTLPSNVTYVSGGTYNAANRTVSFTVNLAAGQTQNYVFTVMVNNGSYYPTTTLFSENFAGAAMPATMTATSSTGTNWTISTAQSTSAPNSAFSSSPTVPSDQSLTNTNGIALGANPSQLYFQHLWDLETGWDGGVLEISTNNGTTWTDLGPKMFETRYNSSIDATAGTPISGREAFTGISNGFKRTAVNLASYTGQTVKIRWRFVSDNGTAATGWYVDDINLKAEPLVIMRTNLFTNTGVRVGISDTVTVITQQATCTNIAITTQPSAVSGCAGGDASFSVTATGTNPEYQWQVSTDGGANFTNIPSATSATLTLTGITGSLNNYQYRVIINNTCPSTVTSNAATLTVTTPAAITNQPASVTVCEGNNATFSVTATGPSNTYQWQVSTDGGTSWTNISGATTTSLNLTSVTTSMNGNRYRVVITSCGPAPLNSDAVTLTVNGNASITTQPSNTNACTGGNASISVIASGSNLSYQWQVSTDGGTSWTNISGATSSTLTLTGITSGMNNNQYQVIVSNSCPSSVTSNAVTLTVSDPATISGHPVNATVCAGTNASFSVTAAGTNISYQWQVSTDGGTTWNNIPGATSATLNLSAVTSTMHNNQYRVVVLSCDPTGLNSAAAILTVNNPASISNHPQSTTVCTGGNASFSVTASGTSVNYQWQVSTDGGTTWNNIPAATTSTLAVNGVTSAMNGNQYRVLLSNICTTSQASNAATLSVGAVSAINNHPEDITVCAGSNATFAVTASGTGNTYQWQVSTDGGTSWNNLSGETGSSLVISSVEANQNGYRYRAVVSGCGTVNSNGAILTVNPNPVVNLAASPYVRLTPDINTVITAASSTTAASYTWYLNGSVIPGATGNTLTVEYSGLGAYSATVTDINGCTGTSGILNIQDSTVNIAFIYPNPNTGLFSVRYSGIQTSAVNRFIVIYDSKGSRVFVRRYVITAPFQVMDVDIQHLSAGTYAVVLLDSQGNRMAQGQVIKE